MLLCLLHSLKLKYSIVNKLVVLYQNVILRIGSQGQFSGPSGSSFPEKSNVFGLRKQQHGIKMNWKLYKYLVDRIRVVFKYLCSLTASFVWKEKEIKRHFIILDLQRKWTFFMTAVLKDCCLDQVRSKIILLWFFIDLDDRDLFLSLA